MVGAGIFIVIINLISTAIVARAESVIIIIKLVALLIFTIAALLYIKSENFSLVNAPKGLYQ